MTVFKAFLKVLGKCKVTIIMYTVILIVFAGINLQTNEKSFAFIAEKPNVFIINNGENDGITKALIEYIEKNTSIIKLENSEEKINDAIFYRDINYLIRIPNNFREDFLSGKNPEIEVKSTGDYQASLARIILDKYLKTASSYQKLNLDEKEIISNVDITLSKEVNVEIASSLDTTSLEKAAFYYNFSNYAILATTIFVICLVLAIFKSEKISKKTIVSSLNYKSYNRILLLANGLFAIVLWLLYIILSFILLGDIMFTTHGILYIANSFIFTLCALTMSLMLGSLVNNIKVIDGLINVIALGSSFLCGAFVPVQWLPSSVLKFAHILPSYWFIQNNELLKNIESFNFNTLRPMLLNAMMLLIFMIIFIIITNIISSRKRKIG